VRSGAARDLVGLATVQVLKSMQRKSSLGKLATRLLGLVLAGG